MMKNNDWFQVELFERLRGETPLHISRLLAATGGAPQSETSLSLKFRALLSSTEGNEG